MGFKYGKIEKEIIKNLESKNLIYDSPKALLPLIEKTIEKEGLQAAAYSAPQVNDLTNIIYKQIELGKVKGVVPAKWMDKKLNEKHKVALPTGKGYKEVSSLGIFKKAKFDLSRRDVHLRAGFVEAVSGVLNLIEQGVLPYKSDTFLLNEATGIVEYASLKEEPKLDDLKETRLYSEEAKKPVFELVKKVRNRIDQSKIKTEFEEEVTPMEEADKEEAEDIKNILKSEFS